MHALVDEMMLEVHYGHPLMHQMFHWCTPRPKRHGGGLDFWCGYSLENATALYQSLRDAGVYAHAWP